MLQNKSFKVGIIMPSFCDQKYLRDRDKIYTNCSEDEAIAKHTESLMNNFFNDDEKRAFRRGEIKVGIVKEE